MLTVPLEHGPRHMAVNGAIRARPLANPTTRARMSAATSLVLPRVAPEQVADWVILRRRAAQAASMAWCSTAVAALAVNAAGVWSSTAALFAIIVHAVLLIGARARLVLHLPCTRLGGGNRITLVRSSLAALFTGFLVDLDRTQPFAVGLVWALAALAVVELVLDGFDGRAARRDGTTSAFGAWADRELDAAFVLVLAAYVWQSGEAGAWVLLAGAWRYLFLAAQLVSPTLRGELAPSSRRRIVGSTVPGVLVGCVSPLFDAPVSSVLAALAVMLLMASFLLDVRAVRRSHLPAAQLVRAG